MKNKANRPSLMFSLTLFFSYNFAAIPITFVAAFAAMKAGHSVELVKTYSSELILCTQILLSILLTSILVNRHKDYLLSVGWENRLKKLLITGLKWTLPLLILHSISLVIPAIRQNLINNYSSINIINVNSTSNITLSLFSILLIMGAVFEELFYRGIVLNIVRAHMNSTISVIITAIIFALSHFIFSEFNIGRLTSSVIVGIFCGLAYISGGSCLSAIVPHLLSNIICAGFLWTSF